MRRGNLQAATCTIWRPTLELLLRSPEVSGESKSRSGTVSEVGGVRGADDVWQLGTMLSVNKSLRPNEDHGNLFQTVFILFLQLRFGQPFLPFIT